MTIRLILTDILLVLHPRHKLEYFKRNGWRDSWIEAAHDIVRDEFDRSYASKNTASEGDVMEASSDDKVSLCVVLVFVLH